MSDSTQDTETESFAYPPPVDRLLTMPTTDHFWDWDEDLARGFGPEHVPDLLRMATDESLRAVDWDRPESRAPYYAWRVLSLLRAEEAIGPLLEALDVPEDEFEDWMSEEVPDLLARIGPAAIPALEAFLADGTKGLYSRVAAGTALEKIPERYPEAREACVAALTRQLEAAEGNPPDLNGFLVGNLVELKAVEAAPVMERAYAAGLVDEWIVGTWDHVQWDLGIGGSPRPKPRMLGWGPPRDLGPRRVDPKKAKARLKQQKKARKQGRKKR